jgi:energy-coupling factor transporter transmembrane protein EcfT
MNNKIGLFLLSILPFIIPVFGVSYTPSTEVYILIVSFVLSVYFVYKINKKISIFYCLLGMILFTLYLLPKPVDIDYFTASNSKNRYYIYNECFLYCEVSIYKKISFLPLMYFYQDGGNLSVKEKNHEIINDSIYIHTLHKDIVLP